MVYKCGLQVSCLSGQEAVLKYLYMPSAGAKHTCLLCSDGRILTCGWNGRGQCDVPVLPERRWYVQVAAGGLLTVALRNDGVVFVCGGHFSRSDTPFWPIQEGVVYTEVAAGQDHMVMLRSDGVAEAWGRHWENQLKVPVLNEGMTYTRVAAGLGHTVFLRNDGIAVACGSNTDSQCDIPVLPKGERYVNIAAGYSMTLLLRSDGVLVLCGYQWQRPGYASYLHKALREFQKREGDTITYSQLSVGNSHIVLLRNDGTVATIGTPDVLGEPLHCCVPPLEDGLKYVQVSAGDQLTVLLRSDGIALTAGDAGVQYDKGDLPHPADGHCFVVTSLCLYVVQLTYHHVASRGAFAVARNLAGDRIASCFVVERDFTLPVEQTIRSQALIPRATQAAHRSRGRSAHKQVHIRLGCSSSKRLRREPERRPEPER